RSRSDHRSARETAGWSQDAGQSECLGMRRERTGRSAGSRSRDRGGKREGGHLQARWDHPPCTRERDGGGTSGSNRHLGERRGNERPPAKRETGRTEPPRSLAATQLKANVSIKFSCPHCKKALTVKDQHAGRRAPCPACKKPVIIPAPVGKPADLEASAAAALPGEPAAAPPPVQSRIEFTCSFCDEKVSVTADLAGKRTPCPECRRIVKVPEPQDNKPKDWRTIDTRRPSA